MATDNKKKKAGLKGKGSPVDKIAAALGSASKGGKPAWLEKTEGIFAEEEQEEKRVEEARDNVPINVVHIHGVLKRVGLSLKPIHFPEELMARLTTMAPGPYSTSAIALIDWALDQIASQRLVLDLDISKFNKE